MSIFYLLQNLSFSPTETEWIMDAHEEALGLLSLSVRGGPLIELIGRKIIAIAKMGETESSVIAARALKDLAIPLLESDYPVIASRAA